MTCRSRWMTFRALTGRRKSASGVQWGHGAATELTAFLATMYRLNGQPGGSSESQQNVRPLLYRRRSREKDLPARPRGPGVGGGPAPGDGADLRPLLDLCRPFLRAEEARRFPLAQGRRPAGDLLPRPAGQVPLPVQHLPPSRRHRLHRARGQPPPLPVHLSWLDLRQRRPARGRAGRRRLCRELRQGRLTVCGGRPGSRSIAASGSCASTRMPTPLADYLGGAKDYIDLVIDQSPSGADGDHRRRAGIRRRRQLEADGGEQRRRLSPAVDPLDLAQLHGQFRREDRAAQGSGPGAADPRQGGRARQRPFHHRQRQFPRPAGRQVDCALWRGGEGRDRRHPRRAGRPPRSGAGAARRRHQPQPGHLPQPGRSTTAPP